MFFYLCNSVICEQMTSCNKQELRYLFHLTQKKINKKVQFYRLCRHLQRCLRDEKESIPKKKKGKIWQKEKGAVFCHIS